MATQAVSENLSGIEFFRDIPSEDLERIAAISRPLEFRAGKDIFHEDERVKDIYFIVSGRVSLVTCNPKVGCRQLAEVSAGDLIGWSPLVGRNRLSDTAHTITKTEVIAIDGGKVLEICQQHPEFGFEFMRRVAQVLAERLSATRLQILDLCGASFPEYVAETD